MNKHNPDSDIGQIITGRLRQIGKTQKWLAEMLDVNPNSLNGLIKGRYTPSKRSLLAIAFVLQIPFEIFFGSEENNE